MVDSKENEKFDWGVKGLIDIIENSLLIVTCFHYLCHSAGVEMDANY